MTRLATLFAACAVTGTLAAGATAYTMKATAQANEVRPSEEFTAQVRAVLMENPEIILEALNAYESQEESARAQAQEKAVAENIDAIWSLPGLHVAGNPDGKVRMVEFFDYRCGFCKRALASVMDMIEAEDELAVAFVEFPILSPASELGSKAAIAAGYQDAYLKMHQALMANTGTLDEARVLKIAGDLGLDVKRLSKDMASAKTKSIVEAHRDMANRLMVDGTPTFLVGTDVVTGFREEQVRALITHHAEMR